MSTVMLIPITRLDAVHSAGWYWRGSVLFVQRIASPTPTGSHVPSGQRPKLHFWFVSSRTACLFLSDCQHNRAIKYVCIHVASWLGGHRKRSTLGVDTAMKRHRFPMESHSQETCNMCCGYASSIRCERCPQQHVANSVMTAPGDREQHHYKCTPSSQETIKTSSRSNQHQSFLPVSSSGTTTHV